MEMKYSSTLILAEGKKNLIKKENDIRNHIVHRDVTLETLNREEPLIEKHLILRVFFSIVVLFNQNKRLIV
jgi:hypothetical protein